MESYLLKFSACLLVFWLVYMLLLERQTIHHFKRFYLMGTLALALLIPQLTLIEYIEPVTTNFESAEVFMPTSMSSVAQMPSKQKPFINLETALWLIYGIGVFLFLIRFVINLVKLYHLISKNETITKRSFIYVLLKEYRIPHSFFKYVFLNKSKFENNAIPDEVILHEETHAKQLHSLDIIVIELLLIIFWFHPLIHILKHHVKLNHEFLADQAVLKQGTDTTTYQNILLQFSSNTHEYQLSSTINYSSIKKRFTVMKTQTSKTRIWVSSFLLLPIIAILFYSFAKKEYVEKTASPPSLAINDEYARSIDLKVLNDNTYFVDGIKATKKTFTDVFNKLHQDITSEERNKIMNIHVSSSKKISDKEIWFIYNALQAYGFYRIITPNQEINRAKGNTPFAIESQLSSQQKATEKQVVAYNAWAQAINAQMIKAKANNGVNAYPIVKIKEVNKYKSIYSIMTEAQKQASEQWPSFPPPPPPPPTKAPKYRNGEKKTLKEIIEDTPKDTESGFEMLVNGESHYFTVNKGKKTYYNKDGFITDEKGKILPPPPPTLKSGQKTKTQEKGGPNINDFEQNKSNPTFLEFITEMEKNGATFFYHDEKISAKEAKNIAKYNTGKSHDMITQKDKNGKYVVKLSKKEYKIKTEAGETLRMTVSDCLEVPSTLKVNSATKELSINCIEDYPNNKFTVYNRFGQIVYTKIGYDNTWKGTDQDKKLLEEGKYYFVLNIDSKKEKPLVGYISIIK